MNRILLSAMGFVFLLPQVSIAQSQPIGEITIVNSGEDRQHVPLRALVHLPPSLKDIKLCRLAGNSSEHSIGQLTRPSLLAEAASEEESSLARELHFVVDHLPADSRLQLEVQPIDSSPTGYRWVKETGLWAELRWGDRPVLRYMHEELDESSGQRRGETYKVYHHVYNPQGTRLVTKGPGGLFPHHRGLFYGFNRISYNGKSADIWHCRNGEYQSHDAFLSSATGPVVGRHRLNIGWHGRDGKVFADEQRELSVYHVPHGMLIEFASRLSSEVGQVKLDGDPQHAGFQFRASQDVPDHTKHLTYYLRPDGRAEPGKFRNWPNNEDHVDLPWNAMSFVLDGTRYTCCYLDHPENPKPARYSERDYGRFGSYFEYTLDENRPLEVNYRIWLQQGEMDVQQVERIHAAFVDPPRVEFTATASTN